MTTTDPTAPVRLSPNELRGLFLFEELDDQKLAWVSEHADVVEVPEGETLCVEG